MAKIRLTGGFTLIPEGVHILQITDAKYDEAFGKLTFTMENKDHLRHMERFALLNGKEPNNAAMNAFSAFARAATGNNNIDEIDPDDLVGCFVKGQISHRTYTSTTGEERTTSQKEPGTYWSSVAPEEIEGFATEEPAVEKKASSVSDLLNLLK